MWSCELLYSVCLLAWFLCLQFCLLHQRWKQYNNNIHITEYNKFSTRTSWFKNKNCSAKVSRDLLSSYSSLSVNSCYTTLLERFTAILLACHVWVVCTRLFFLRWTKTKTYFFAFRGSKICWFLILFPSFYFETEGTTTANDAIKKQERRVQKSLFSWLSKNHSIEKLFHSSKS